MTELISWSAKFRHQSLVVSNQQSWGLHCRWFVVVQSLSHVWLFATLWTAVHQASLSFIISQSLLKLISIESGMPSNHLVLCHPLLHLPSIFPSTGVFSKLVLCIQWPPKYWCFNFSMSPSNEYSDLISFRIDGFDLLAVWGGLLGLLGSKDHCTMLPYTSLQSSKCVALVQLLSCVRHFAILWTVPCQAPLSSTLSCSLLKVMSTELMILSKQLILCQPFLLLPVMFPSIRVFSTELTLCISWPTYWSFNFSISSSNEYSRLISFGIEWIELLAAQGTLKSLLQHHISKWSILQCSAFFIVQLLHP